MRNSRRPGGRGSGHQWERERDAAYGRRVAETAGAHVTEDEKFRLWFWSKPQPIAPD